MVGAFDVPKSRTLRFRFRLGIAEITATVTTIDSTTDYSPGPPFVGVSLWKGSIASKGSTVPRAQSFRAAHFRRRVFATARLQLSVLRAGYQAPRSGTAAHCIAPRVTRTRCRRVGVTRRDGLQTILFVGRVSHHVRVGRNSLFDPFITRFLDPFAAVAPEPNAPR